MGGKLFNLPRMPRAEYVRLEDSMRRYLDKKLGGEYRIPRFYGDKPDFGDMDILLSEREDWLELRSEIVLELGIEQTKTAGRVFSTVYQGLQTDFFTVEPRYLDSTYRFMSFNDLGNFLGRMVRRFNLKYGEHGLSYVYRRASDEHYKVNLEITQDFSRICAFLGLDFAQWECGFENLEALFAWVVQSPYFSVAPYLDTMLGTLEKRSKDRTTVINFVEWLKQNNHNQRPQFANRESYLPMIVEFFPEAKLDWQIEQERQLEAKAVLLASKFSGKLVMQLLPHLNGKRLGGFIVAFKASFEDFEAFVLQAEPSEIEGRVLDFASRYG